MRTKYVQPLDAEEQRKANRPAIDFNGVFLLIAIILMPVCPLRHGVDLHGGRCHWLGGHFLLLGTVLMCICEYLKQIVASWIKLSYKAGVIWPVVRSWPTIWRIRRGMIKDTARGGKAKANAGEATTFQA